METYLKEITKSACKDKNAKGVVKIQPSKSEDRLGFYVPVGINLIESQKKGGKK